MESVKGRAWEQLRPVNGEEAPRYTVWLWCCQRFLPGAAVDTGTTCKIRVIALDVLLLLGAVLVRADESTTVD